MTTDAAGDVGPESGARRPDAAEVEAELQRVLASRCFEQAGRAKNFLKFVVDETLAGRGDRLKGYTIGVEVFGRPTDFDAQNDPLVRVEAGRIRSRLTQYYGDEGAKNPIRITLARGGYAPQFSFADLSPAATAAPNTVVLSPQTRLRRGLAIVVAAAGAAMLGLLAFVLVSMPSRTVKPLPGATVDSTSTPAALGVRRGPKVLVLPFANLSGSTDLDYFAYGLTDEIMLRLGDLDVSVMGSTGGNADTSSTEVGPVPAAWNATYVLTGSARSTGDQIRLTARLSAADSGAQLWAEAFDEPADVRTLLAFQERVAARVAGTITRPFGPIFNQEIVRATRAPPEQLATYDCVLKYRYYRRTFEPRDHRETADCFRRAVVREPGLADAWAGLALVYLDEYLYGYNAENGPVDALTRAREAAIKACDIEGDNRLALLAMARLRLAEGDVDGFERAVERLLALTPHNADDLATIASLRGVAEGWERSLPLLDEALSLYAPGRAPNAFFIAQALHALEIGDYDQALEHALKIDTPSWPLSTVVVAASAGLAGRADIAHRATQRLLELQPEFPRHARAQFARWHPREALLTRFLEGLRAAGIDIP